MIGARKPQHINVRIIAASNKNIDNLIKSGAFREDLFFRINVINVELPPLRERDNDILLLISHFTEKYAEEMGKKIPVFSTESLKVLKNYTWPGNVRELENIIQRLIVMTENKQINVSDLPSIMRFSAINKNFDLNKSLSEIEAEHIKNILDSTKGNKTRAAEILGIDRKTLRDKIKKYKIK